MNSNHYIPTDLVSLNDFLRKRNIELPNYIKNQMKKSPDFPSGFLVGKKKTLHSEAELDQFFIDRMVSNA